MPFLVVSAPENALRPDAGVQALLHRAGAGDEVVFVQMYEHKFFGESSSNPVADPNPRLEAAIGAARRGARVRLLLDSFFDDPDGLRNKPGDRRLRARHCRGRRPRSRCAGRQPRPPAAFTPSSFSCAQAKRGGRRSAA
ncbi:hypothetical protein [Caldilinea sp.]|uniref:hypothetical protein n=1 Tax=Caldilinea sp. TaxID=2293560 RepID=UPI002611495E|nr:hypothetical protein [Caldilinea sp.]